MDSLGFELLIEQPEVRRWAKVNARRYRNVLARQTGVPSRLCEWCGIEFEPTGRNQRFCEPRCKWLLHRAKGRQRTEQAINDELTEWVMSDACFDLPPLADEDLALFPAL